jgi:hypothetical protein
MADQASAGVEQTTSRTGQTTPGLSQATLQVEQTTLRVRQTSPMVGKTTLCARLTTLQVVRGNLAGESDYLAGGSGQSGDESRDLVCQFDYLAGGSDERGDGFDESGGATGQPCSGGRLPCSTFEGFVGQFGASSPCKCLEMNRDDATSATGWTLPSIGSGQAAGCEKLE